MGLTSFFVKPAQDECRCPHLETVERSGQLWVACPDCGIRLRVRDMVRMGDGSWWHVAPGRGPVVIRRSV